MTTTGVSTDQLSAFTSALWRVAESTPSEPPGQDREIRRVIAASPRHEVAEQLQALIHRVDELDQVDRRRFAASVDDVQIRSKLWLIRELSDGVHLDRANIVVLGAWFGVLPLLIDLTLQRPPARMICVDIDPSAVELGRRVIGPLYPNIEYLVADAMDLDYPSIAQERSSVLVNTICEHLPDARGWWAKVHPGQLAVLQSNNYDLCPDHVNCVSSTEEMKAQTPMTTVLYEGSLRLPIFDRYMLIGYR